MKSTSSAVVAAPKPVAPILAPLSIIPAAKKPSLMKISPALVPAMYHLTHASLGGLCTLGAELLYHPFLNFGTKKPLYANFKAVLPNIGVQFYYHGAYEAIRKSIVTSTLLPLSLTRNPFFVGPVAAVTLEVSKALWHIPLLNMSRKGSKGLYDGWKASFFPGIPYVVSWFTACELSNTLVPKIVAPRVPGYCDHFIGSFVAGVVAVTVTAPGRVLVRRMLEGNKKKWSDLVKEETTVWHNMLCRTVPRSSTRRVAYMFTKKQAYAALQKLTG